MGTARWVKTAGTLRVNVELKRTIFFANFWEQRRYFTPTGKELIGHTSKPSEKVSHKDFFSFFFSKVMLQELSWRYHWPKGHFFWMSREPKEMTPGFEILLFPLWKISVQLKRTILAGSKPDFMGTEIRKFYGQNSHWTNCFQCKASNFLIKLQCLTLLFHLGEQPVCY